MKNSSGEEILAYCKNKKCNIKLAPYNQRDYDGKNEYCEECYKECNGVIKESDSARCLYIGLRAV